MVHCYRFKSGYNEILWTKTYAIDLTQGNRVFDLEHSGVNVRDAFILGNDFVFAGCKSRNDPLALFKYDISNKTAEEMFQLVSAEKFPTIVRVCGRFIEGRNFGLSVLYRSEENDIFEQIWRIGDDYHLLVNTDKHDMKKEWSYLRFNKETGGSNKYTVEEVLHYDDIFAPPWPIHTDHFLLFFTDSSVQKYDFRTGEKTYIAYYDRCDLLGDYLYLKDGKEIKKTNISNGVDKLQWEIVSFPD